MSFNPIDPSGFVVPGHNPPEFSIPDDICSLPLLTQPESDPSIAMDIDDSVAIDRVRAILASDFTDERAPWLHLVASLLVDARNGVRDSTRSSSICKFQDLSPFEKSTLSTLKLALESFETFFDDIQDDAEDWVTCMNCVNMFQLPASKEEWTVNLTECSHQVEMARKLTVDRAIEQAHTFIQDWVNRERSSAQDAAINSLTSDHAPDVSTLISDPRLVEWSCHLLEVMKHHFTETLVSDASHTLPQPLADRLDAECQAKFNAAEEDACADAKRLYEAELLRRQTVALSDASADYSAWVTSTLTPECQAKEFASRVNAEREFARFKMDLETEFAEKRRAVLTAANDDLAAFQLVHAQVPKPRSSGDDTLDKRARRAKRRADPLSCPSCSASRAWSPSPSPSQKLDKTPTKADFHVVSQTISVPPCAPVSDHARGWARPSIAQVVSGSNSPVTIVVPLAGTDIAKASVGTLGDAESGLPSTPICCPPRAQPAAALLETSLGNPIPDVVMAPAAPLGDACPSPAAPHQVFGIGITPTASDSPLVVPLVEHYQSAALSPTPPPTFETAEDRMMRLLGSTITAALVPLKSSIDDISSRLHTVEEAQDWAPSNDMPDDYDLATQYCIPTLKAEAGDEERVDYHVASALSQTEEEDAEMAEARDAFAERDHGDHPYFESVILRAREESCAHMDPDQLKALASGAAEAWDDFCHRHCIPRRTLPPSEIVDDTFVKHTRMHLAQAQLEDEFTRATRLARGSTVSSAPDYIGRRDAWHADSRRFRTLLDNPLLAPPPPAHTSEPISISSDGTKASGSKISGFTESSPPAQTHHRAAGGVLDLDTPPPGEGHGWSVMGGQKGRSFASIAATKPPGPGAGAPPTALPPFAAQAAHGFLTKPQLDSLTRAQVINAFNARFTPKLGLKVSKDNVVAAFLDKSSRPVPNAPAAPKPITKAEYTLVYDSRAGDLAAPSGHRSDAVSYVCSIQAHVCNAGTKQAELIGGRWTSQTSRNFVLMFNGNPSLDDVLHLWATFTKVFRPHYSIVPSKGYTWVVLNSVPTMKEALDDLLPSASDLRIELACNAGLKDLILLGDPYWLTARHQNASHGSISVAFIDQDGLYLKDIM